MEAKFFALDKGRGGYVEGENSIYGYCDVLSFVRVFGFLFF